jgi:hypothetical protein
MKIYSTYSVKIKQYNHIFSETVTIYRDAVNFLMDVCLAEWDLVSAIKGNQAQMMYVESLCHKTKENSSPKYDFDSRFYKMPSYIRRAAISEAIGKVSSYKSNLANWKLNPTGKKPTLNNCGYVYPSLYRIGMYNLTDDYSAQIKIYHNNTWNWLSISLRKSDMDYIYHRCNGRKMCAPTLQKRGKEWFLDFPFEEKTTLTDTNSLVVGVDLGLNSACTCCIMDSKGTIYGRRFLRLPSETDRLNHAVNRIKKAQQYGNRKMPRLWAKAKGINDDIAVKTANFIIDTAVMYNVDTVVFEHLDLAGKKRGSKKQKLHMWKAKYVQSMVTDKAHRLSMRISHICAWGTSQLAFDGSGRVLRGKDADMPTYSLCKFQNGKTYNCDLNASYNIAARYYIREIFKSCSVTDRLDIEAKVPQCSKRSTCTLADLISLNAVLDNIFVA